MNWHPLCLCLELLKKVQGCLLISLTAFLLEVNRRATIQTTTTLQLTTTITATECPEVCPYSILPTLNQIYLIRNLYQYQKPKRKIVIRHRLPSLPRDSSPRQRYNLTLRLCVNVSTSTSKSRTRQLTPRVKVNLTRKMILNCKCRSIFRLVITMRHEVNRPLRANQSTNRFRSEIKSEKNNPPLTLA